MLHSLAYVSFQELATRVSHRNTGRVTGDPICEALLARVAADENLHMIFYRNLLGAAFELAPSQAMRAVTDVVADFQMPGTGIEGFARKSVAIAMAGIYDLRLHRDDVLQPVLRQWDVFNVRASTPTARRPASELAAQLEDLEQRRVPFRGEARRPSRPPALR